MRIVIDIDEDTYKDIKRGKIYTSVRDVPQESVVAIANGIPLPKGHGRLIDADAVYDDFEKGEYDFEESLEFAPTIIPADKDGEE